MRNAVGAPLAALSWLGRQGTRAVAAAIVISVAVPGIGVPFRQFITATVFALLCIAFLRLDGAALRKQLRRPGLVLLATAWTSAAVPALLCTAYWGLGISERSPDLYSGLVLQAVAPPLMAAPALAALIGLDVTLTLCTMVLGTALLPLTAPLFAYAFLGSEFPVSPLALGLQLAALLSLSALCGLLVRRLAGGAAIERQRSRIDGVNIVVMFVFVASLMDGVGAQLIAQPREMTGLALLAFLIALALFGVTTLLFIASGRQRALTLGFVVAERNTGLMLAAAAGALSHTAWQYFAFTYFPLYLLPLLVQPLVRARGRRPGSADAGSP